MTNFLLFVVVLAQTTTAVEAPKAPRGQVCIGARKSILTAGTCAKTTGTSIEVAPADEERQFVWTSDDLTTAQLGIVPPKVKMFELDPAAATSTIQLSLDGERTRGWPADVNVTVAAKEQWRWLLDAKAATRLRRLVVPRGQYMIQLKAERHRAQRRAPVAATGEAVDLGELRLLPLPAARGVVVDAEGKPIDDATVTLPDGALCATVNEQGAFVCELPEPLPEAVVVTSSGRGLREFALPPKVTEDVDLGRITLTAGRVLALKIVRPDRAAGKVTLFHDAEKRYDHSKLKSVELSEREEEVRFDVGEGKYLALIEGSDPLSKLEVALEVKESDVEQTITVAPYQLQGSVKFGEEAVTEGRLEIIAPQHSWRATVPLANGAFGGTMWQPGLLVAFVESKALGVSDLVESPELGDDPSRWDVRIEKRMIVGRVFDAETKAPVAGVDFGLTADFGSGSSHSTLRPEPDGSYRILAKPGTYSLRVSSREHVAYKADVVVTADDRTKTHDIALERGVLQRLEVVTPSGAPIANALVLEGVQPDGINPQFIERTDTTGQYALRGRGGETRLLYVVPQDGSLAVVRVAIPPGEAKPLRVVVPPAAGALRVRTVNDNKEPAPAGLLLRYNGEFVPNAILRFVTGETAHTYPGGEGVVPRLPAGTYEVWAVTARDGEARMIASGGTLKPPVRVGLSAGEQSVTVIAPPRPPQPQGM